MKKIEEHKLKNDTEEWQKQQEYNSRRKRRKELRKILQSKARLNHVKKLFILSILAICLGVIITFGATIRTVSDGSLFWTHKEKFKIIGPVVIVAGIAMLLVAVGLENSVTTDIKASGDLDVTPFIHPDFIKTKMCFTSQYSQDSSYSSGNDTDSRLDRHRRIRYDTHSSVGEEDFLCSSLASTASVSQYPPGLDLTARWAKAMTITVDETGNTVSNSSRNGNNSRYTAVQRVDSGVLRVLHNAPSIQVTDIDGSLNDTSSTSNSGTAYLKSSSLTSLSKLKFNDSDLYRTESDKVIKLDVTAPRGTCVVAKDITLHGISEESVSHIKVHESTVV